MFSVSHMISSSEKMWLHENISPFFISLVLNFHSSFPLTRSSTLMLFSYCEVCICRCECTLGATNWPIHAALRFRSASKTRNEFKAL